MKKKSMIYIVVAWMFLAAFAGMIQYTSSHELTPAEEQEWTQKWEESPSDYWTHAWQYNQKVFFGD
jgi:hypothetical protein